MLRFMVRGERNLLLSMEMSFFGMPLAQTWLARTQYNAKDAILIVRIWLQFIPIFGALHSQLRKGHTIKKDIPMFFCIEFVRSA
jgi:hypothetical protein